MDFSWLFTPQTLIAFLTLVVLELVLGVDNVIFISILAGKLPQQDQRRARTTGIALAVITRILLLLSLSWIISLEEPFFFLPWFGGEALGISGRDLILLAGGLFLLGKSTYEIHEKLEGHAGHSSAKVASTFASVIMQILLLDVVFSLDSVITAVGMVDHIEIMIIAVIVSAVVMIFTAGPIGEFVERHPTIKILALSFLLLIGFTLVVEGLHQHIPKGYIYFAMGFSIFVEMMNLRIRGKGAQPVVLHSAYADKNDISSNSDKADLKALKSNADTTQKKADKRVFNQSDDKKKHTSLRNPQTPLVSAQNNSRVSGDNKPSNELVGIQSELVKLNLSQRPLRAFICHSSQDKVLVRALYKRLKTESWIDPWLDEEKLLPGQDWDLEIYKSIRNADVILVCLSSNSIAKEGYIQKEFKRALELAEEKPEGSIYIIPLRLDDCTPPFRFQKWQWLDYFSKDSHQRLLQSLRTLETKG